MLNAKVVVVVVFLKNSNTTHLLMTCKKIIINKTFVAGERLDNAARASGFDPKAERELEQVQQKEEKKTNETKRIIRADCFC